MLKITMKVKEEVYIINCNHKILAKIILIENGKSPTFGLESFEFGADPCKIWRKKTFEKKIASGEFIPECPIPIK